MLILRCSSEKPLGALVRSAGALRCPCLLLSPRAFEGKSEMELAFAFYLARRAFEAKGNISGKMANEALLFLAREMNFASAVRRVGAKDAGDFVFVCEKNVPLAKVKREMGLTSAKRVALPKMGRKKGAYFEGERAVEGMAIARVKN
jgi:tRNA threonylcarbamoyladenosine modification (KEOPS) complex Cgi121 subunit